MNTNNIEINVITDATSSPAIVKPKRGRRSKKEIALALLVTQQAQQAIAQSSTTIFSSIQNSESMDNIIVHKTLLHDDTNNMIDLNLTNDENTVIKPPSKKRGRKPKGGKIVPHNPHLTIQKEEKTNVILHLKCSMKDIANNSILDNNIINNNNSIISNSSTNSVNASGVQSLPFGSLQINNNNSINNSSSSIKNNNTNILFSSCTNSNNNIDVEAFNFNTSKNELSYDIISNPNNICHEINGHNHGIFNNTHESITAQKNNEQCDSDESNYETKDIWRKLKILEHNLHINNISDKKSACFWCSYDFDNPPIYIPKHFIQESYHVYGCFCSPECAVAHLMEENIDSSMKFERYHLMNHIYSKIYDYKKNIKPAPNPYYMLERYYGNLTIQEYRSLLKSERLFLIVDKPLTRILPEFHEDNDEFIINSKIIPSNNYQVKKRLQKKQQTKNNILNDKFGAPAAM